MSPLLLQSLEMYTQIVAGIVCLACVVVLSVDLWKRRHQRHLITGFARRFHLMVIVWILWMGTQWELGALRSNYPQIIPYLTVSRTFLVLVFTVTFVTMVVTAVRYDSDGRPMNRT